MKVSKTMEILLNGDVDITAAEVELSSEESLAILVEHAHNLAQLPSDLVQGNCYGRSYSTITIHFVLANPATDTVPELTAAPGPVAPPWGEETAA